jgi:hypothetical protein
MIYGQSLIGITGLLNIPSADMQDDGTLYAGVNYINQNSYVSVDPEPYDRYAWYFDITFFKFLEVNFRSTTYRYDTNSYNVDRALSLKARVLRERKYWPAIVIGSNDAFQPDSYGGNQFFVSTYVVLTKHIPVKKSEFAITLGYGYNFQEQTGFEGLFGGVSFSPGFLRQMNLIAEYDGRNFNLGGNVLFFKHLFVFGMVHDLKHFSGGLAYRLYLMNYYKRNKKKMTE